MLFSFEFCCLCSRLELKSYGLVACVSYGSDSLNVGAVFVADPVKAYFRKLLLGWIDWLLAELLVCPAGPP